MRWNLYNISLYILVAVLIALLGCLVYFGVKGYGPAPRRFSPKPLYGRVFISKEEAIHQAQMKEVLKHIRAFHNHHGVHCPPHGNSEWSFISSDALEKRYYNEEFIPAYQSGRTPKVKGEWAHEQKIIGVTDYEAQAFEFLNNARAWLEKHPLQQLPWEFGHFTYNDTAARQQWNADRGTEAAGQDWYARHSTEGSNESNGQGNEGVEDSSGRGLEGEEGSVQGDSL